MSNITYNPETHYLETKIYTNKNGDEKQYHYLVKRTAKSDKKGRPFTTPSVDLDKLKELRELGLSWGKIGKKLDISAYHAQKIYTENSSEHIVV